MIQRKVRRIVRVFTINNTDFIGLCKKSVIPTGKKHVSFPQMYCQNTALPQIWYSQIALKFFGLKPYIYTVKQKRNRMKRNIVFAFCATAFLMASCGTDEATEETNKEEESTEQQDAAEEVSYTLDTEASTLNWKGTEGEHEFHVGTIDFSEGNLTMKGDEVVSGSFVVDMSTIQVTDEDMSDKGKAKLTGHLGAEDVFHIAQYAATTVTLGDYTDGKLNIVVNIVGKEIPATVPVSITQDENGAKISGDFSIDFTDAGIPLFAPQENPEESKSPVIQYSMNAVLVKK